MLLGYQSSKYSSLPPPRLYFRPCGYRNVNYFLTVAVHLYRKLSISVKILINLLLWKVNAKVKRSKYHTKYGVRVGRSPVCIRKVMGSIPSLVIGYHDWSVPEYFSVPLKWPANSSDFTTTAAFHNLRMAH